MDLIRWRTGRWQLTRWETIGYQKDKQVTVREFHRRWGTEI